MSNMSNATGLFQTQRPVKGSRTNGNRQASATSSMSKADILRKGEQNAENCLNAIMSTGAAAVTHIRTLLEASGSDAPIVMSDDLRKKDEEKAKRKEDFEKNKAAGTLPTERTQRTVRPQRPDTAEEKKARELRRRKRVIHNTLMVVFNKQKMGYSVPPLAFAAAVAKRFENDPTILEDVFKMDPADKKMYYSNKLYTLIGQDNANQVAVFRMLLCTEIVKAAANGAPFANLAAMSGPSLAAKATEFVDAFKTRNTSASMEIPTLEMIQGSNFTELEFDSEGMPQIDIIKDGLFFYPNGIYMNRLAQTAHVQAYKMLNGDALPPDVKNVMSFLLSHVHKVMGVTLPTVINFNNPGNAFEVVDKVVEIANKIGAFARRYMLGQPMAGREQIRLYKKMDIITAVDAQKQKVNLFKPSTETNFAAEKTEVPDESAKTLAPTTDAGVAGDDEGAATAPATTTKPTQRNFAQMVKGVATNKAT